MNTIVDNIVFTSDEIVEKLNNIVDISKGDFKDIDELINYMREYNYKVDVENIGDNGFENETQVDEFWYNEKKTDVYIYKVFDEYYGIEELIKLYKGE